MRHLTDILGDARIAFRALAQQKLFAGMAILTASAVPRSPFPVPRS